MSDTPEVAAAREALAEEQDARARDGAPIARRFALVGHLGAALDALDAVTAERDRLRDILAAERGERGPEGWEWGDESWTRGDSGVGPWAHVGAPKMWGGPWSWEVTAPCGHVEHADREWPKVASGTASTALAAMMAAEAAMEARDGR